MRPRPALVAVIAILAVLTLSGAAVANDAVKASVNASTADFVMQNGNPYAQGTYAVGTIQLFYTVNAFAFTPGPFASFTVGLGAQAGSGRAPVYPVNLSLEQIGSTDLALTPDTGVFAVSGLSWTGAAVVTISLPAGLPDEDGTDLVGNLRLSTPGGSHLDTVTNIQVHIKLVHPSACIKLYHFLTNLDSGSMVTSTTVVSRNGSIKSANPGQLSDDVLVVNTCSADHTFDLLVALDSSFSTNPNGNPGNAVFTFFKSGSVEPSTFSLAAFGTGTPQGQSLQLKNVTVPAGQTFLATVHIGINKGPDTLAASGTFTFLAALYLPGTSVVDTAVGPANPVEAALNYTK